MAAVDEIERDYNLDNLRERIKSVTDYSQKMYLEGIKKHLTSIEETRKNLGELAAFLAARKFLSNMVQTPDEDFDVGNFLKDLQQVKLCLSPKVICLLRLLRKYQLPMIQQKKRCIVFVGRRMIAEGLHQLLALFGDIYLAGMSFGYVVGLGNRGSALTTISSTDQIHATFSAFRNGTIDTLIATNVAEEGIDIPTCHLVIIFDSFRTTSGYIQSRGRARDLGSKYLVMVEEGCRQSLIKYRDVVNAAQNTKSLVADSFFGNNSMLVRKSELDDEFSVLICGGYDTPLVSSTGAFLYPNGALPLLHWYGSKCGILVNFTTVWPTDTPWRDVYLSIKAQWTNHYGSPEEAAILDAFEIDGPPAGYVVQCALQGEHIFYSSVRQTSKAARKNAAYIACQYLHRSGKLDEHFLPVKRSSSGSTEETDTKSLTIHPYGSKAFCSALFPSNCFFTAVYFVEELENYCEKHSPSFILITPGKLPDIDQTRVWKDNQCRLYCKVDLINGITLSDVEFLKVVAFQSRIWDVVTSGLADCPLEEPHIEGNYLIAPSLFKDNDWQINWKLMEIIAGFPIQSLKSWKNENNDIMWKKLYQALHKGSKSSFDSCLNEVICETKHNGFKYTVEKILTGTTAKNHFSKGNRDKFEQISYVEYFISRGYHNIEDEVPLVQARALQAMRYNLSDQNFRTSTYSAAVQFPQEVLTVLPFTKTYIEYAQMLPSIIHRVFAYSKAQDMLNMFEISAINLKSFSPALFASTAEIDENYERMETLGDTILKFAVSLSLLMDNLDQSSGNLSIIRSATVSNRNLCQLGITHGLDGMLETTPFKPEYFKRAGVFLIASSKCREKQIADFVEAIIGGLFVCSGITSAWKFIYKLGLVSQREIKPFDSPSVPSRHSLMDISNVETKLGYHFKNKSYAVRALIHPTVGSVNYDSLEFLGDALLDFAFMNYFYCRYTSATPGELSSLKTAAVNNESCCFVASDLGIEEHVIVGNEIRDSIQNYKNSLISLEYNFDPDMEG
jgi:endoribonuclease Dicer